MTSKQPHYLIVRSGVFGASTALHLRRSKPEAEITIVDKVPYPNPSSASHDLNEIIRADYHDIFYTKLALEAQEWWRHNSIFKPWYHECGMCFTEKGGWTHQATRNFEQLGVETGSVIMSLEEGRERFPEFRNADWAGADGIYFNPTSGWGEADKAMGALMDAVVAEGTTFRQGNVSSLLLRQDGSCRGVKLMDATELTADIVLLCTGAGTAKLLADTAPNDESLQVGGRMVAAGAIQCAVFCDPEHREEYVNAPVHFNGGPHIMGECNCYLLPSIVDQFIGESIPLLPDGRAKFNYEGSFSNMTRHVASGQTFSVPPDSFGQTTWTPKVPATLEKEVLNVVASMYGRDAPGLHPRGFRMCW